MITNPQEMRASIGELSTSVWTLTAIGVLLESGLVEHLREPRSADDLAPLCPALSKGRIERCLAVAASAGVVTVEGARYRLAEGAMPFSQQPMRTTLQGDIRSHLMQSLAFLDSATGKGASSGWRHTDPVLLQAQGDGSAMFAPMLKMNIAPMLGDLAAQLEKPGARFLDVGVGVAALAISMCRAWPNLHVTGLDTFDAPLAIARENVARAAMGDRIDLRQIAAQDLRDEASFDLAWLPSFFIPAPTLASALARVHASLRPGGWMLFAIGGFPAEGRPRDVFALMNELWGGPVLFTAEAEALLKKTGFSTVRVLPSPPTLPPFFAAQR